MKSPAPCTAHGGLGHWPADVGGFTALGPNRLRLTCDCGETIDIDLPPGVTQADIESGRVKMALGDADTLAKAVSLLASLLGDTSNDPDTERRDRHAAELLALGRRGFHRDN